MSALHFDTTQMCAQLNSFEGHFRPTFSYFLTRWSKLEWTICFIKVFAQDCLMEISLELQLEQKISAWRYLLDYPLRQKNIPFEENNGEEIITF